MQVAVSVDLTLDMPNNPLTIIRAVRSGEKDKLKETFSIVDFDLDYERV